MKFNESTECLVNTFVLFKICKETCTQCPIPLSHLHLCCVSVKSHHPVKAVTFSDSAQTQIAERFTELKFLLY